jgi:hypothetical protein
MEIELLRGTAYQRKSAPGHFAPASSHKVVDAKSRRAWEPHAENLVLEKLLLGSHGG